MGSNDAIAGDFSGRWRNNGICVSLRSSTVWLICFSGFACSTMWHIALHGVHHFQRSGSRRAMRLRTTLLQRVLTITGSQRDPV